MLIDCLLVPQVTAVAVKQFIFCYIMSSVKKGWRLAIMSILINTKEMKFIAQQLFLVRCAKGLSLNVVFCKVG